MQVAVMTPEQIESLVERTIQRALPVGKAERPGKKLLTGKDVEEEYGIYERNLERWRANGSGPPYTSIGKRIFYERAELDAFIADGRVKTSRLWE